MVSPLPMESWLRETKGRSKAKCRGGVGIQLCHPSKPILPLDHIHAQSKTRLKAFLLKTYPFLFPISENGITIKLVIQEWVFFP